MMFQMLRKYDPGCRTNPRATTLKSASMQKIPKKYISVSSCTGNKTLTVDMIANQKKPSLEVALTSLATFSSSDLVLSPMTLALL